MFELVGKTAIDFLGMRRQSFALSGALVLLGLLAFVEIGRGTTGVIANPLPVGMSDKPESQPGRVSPGGGYERTLHFLVKREWLLSESSAILACVGDA